MIEMRIRIMTWLTRQQIARRLKNLKSEFSGTLKVRKRALEHRMFEPPDSENRKDCV